MDKPKSSPLGDGGGDESSVIDICTLTAALKGGAIQSLFTSLLIFAANNLQIFRD